MREQTFFEGTVEAEAMKNQGEGTAVMKAIQSGLGLKESSALYFSHTHCLAKGGGEAGLRRVSPPAPSAPCGRTKTLWFPHTWPEPEPTGVISEFAAPSGAWNESSS